MAFTLSESEREDLKNLRDRAQEDTENGISGSYAAAYRYIAKRLTEKDSIAGLPPYSPAERDPDFRVLTHPLRLVLRVAAYSQLPSPPTRPYNPHASLTP